MIEELIALENWPAARKLIEQRLVVSPDDHWLLTRLSLTYYEERQYRRALELSKQAVALQPRCPLALWDYAGALDMLGQYDEATKVYRRLIRRGLESVAYDECGEGRAWARGLLADCHYRIALCFKNKGNVSRAITELEVHLQQRGPGCRSIYPIGDARKELHELREMAA